MSDDFILLDDCTMPIIGSRVFNKIYVIETVLAVGENVKVAPQAVMNWTDIQDKHYRYVCWLDYEHLSIKLVIDEFLFATIVFKLDR